MTRPACCIGVDVGTASAGIFDLGGALLGSARHRITVHRDGATVEQSSAEIWDAVAASVRGAVAEAGVSPEQVTGIGFNATCSLVVGGDAGSLPVGDPANADRDIVVWMDHRAVDQARRINAEGHDVLKDVGGVISPEMDTPKLLWLKENRREVSDAARHFFDLTDWLTWRATGSLARSATRDVYDRRYAAFHGLQSAARDVERLES